MFDDPQKELKRLEEQLLKNQEKDEEFERFYQDIFREFGGAEEPVQRAVAPQNPRKSAPSGAVRKSTYEDTPRAVAPAKKQSNLGLVIVLCIEVTGILGVAGYWLAKFL